MFVQKLSEDERKAVRDMATDCRTAEGGSEQDVEDLIDNKIPESREGKCVGFCMMKQFSMVSDFFAPICWFLLNDWIGKFIIFAFKVKEKSDAPGEFVFCKDCLIQMTNAGIEDEEKRKQVQEIIEACESTANPDRYVFNVFKQI